MSAHQLKLKENSFSMITTGTKVLEIRLYDEKRQKIEIGDFIIFSKLPDLLEKIKTVVTDIKVYKNFATLLGDIDIKQAGWIGDEHIEKMMSDLTKYYTLEEQKKYKAVCLRIKLVL